MKSGQTRSEGFGEEMSQSGHDAVGADDPNSSAPSVSRGGEISLPSVATIAIIVAALSMLGQFAIAAYLPAFTLMSADLQASTEQIQQSLTAYMLPFALMIPWHGAISDAVGRRRMILLGCGLFAVGSLMCASATSIWELHAGRAVQGVSAGIGIIVGRALVRDLFEGMHAQRDMAVVSMIFA